MIPRFCIQSRITDREATPCSVAHLLEVMSSPEVQAICDQIKLLDGKDAEELASLKKQLPVITPHAQSFTNNERKNQNAIPSGLAMLDADDVEDPIALSNSLDGTQLKDNDIYFVAITPSGHGLRVIAARQPGESIQAAQQRLAHLYGLAQYDSSTKDPARASFVMPRSYLLYIDESGLEFASEEEATRIATQFSQEHIGQPSTTQSPHSAASAESRSQSEKIVPQSDLHNSVPGGHGTGRGDEGTSPSRLRKLSLETEPTAAATAAQFLEETSAQKVLKEYGGSLEQTSGGARSAGDICGTTALRTDENTVSFPQDYKGIAYKTIVDQLVTLLGGTPQLGERNTFYFTLVKFARYICDFQADLVLHVLPDFGLSESERRQVITSALNRPRKSELPDMVQRAITAAQLEQELNVDEGDRLNALTSQSDLLNATTLPKLPHVLDIICRRLPEAYRPAMVIAALPILGTLATKVRFNYLDHQEHSFSFMSCITAPAATGKSFIRRPVNLLLTPIDEQDDIEREKEQEYKDKLRAAKNAKMQPENPRACPRNNGINISIAKLLQLLSYSEGKHLIGIGEEIDTLVKSERAGVWSQKSDIYRLGFDNAKYGQNYMSDNSFSANVPVYYNLLLTGTPGGMYRFFKDVEDGLVTRFAFAQLPDMFGTDIPDFQPYTTSEESEIIRIARMLDMASGTITCPAVDEAISQWLQQKKEAAIAADSRAIDTIRKRAAVMGFRAGYLAALLNGSAKHISSSSRESRTAKRSRKSSDSQDVKSAAAADFALWIAEYIFQNQMQLFGDKFEAVSNEWIYAQEHKGTVKSLLAKLPESFSRSELMAIRARNGQSTEIRYVLSRWLAAGLIVRVDNNNYYKTTRAS